MPRLETRRFDDGRGGSVSGVLAHPDPERPRATLVVLAHGAGNDMRNPLLSAVHEGLATRGYPCAKFNFPYTERGARAPDPAPVLEACFRSVVAAIRQDPALGTARVVIGGKSLGGRIASQVAAGGWPVDGLVFLGYPLHPAGRPETLRVAHWPSLTAPLLFFAGTRDPLCSLPLLREALGALRAPVALHVVEGGDHSFAVPKRAGRRPADVYDEIVAVAADWLAAGG